MYKTTWKLQKEEARQQEYKDIALLVIGVIMFLITVKYN